VEEVRTISSLFVAVVIGGILALAEAPEWGIVLGIYLTFAVQFFGMTKDSEK
jgi:hypothetical protein